MSDRIDLGAYQLPEGISLRLGAEITVSPENGTLLLSIFARPAGSEGQDTITNEERARYSIWLARIGDNPWVVVDHAQGMSTVAERDGEPYLYWHGKAPRIGPYT
jgi:hypothetical protein